MLVTLVTWFYFSSAMSLYQAYLSLSGGDIPQLQNYLSSTKVHFGSIPLKLEMTLFPRHKNGFENYCNVCLEVLLKCSFIFTELKNYCNCSSFIRFLKWRSQIEFVICG